MKTKPSKSQKGLYLVEFALVSGAFFLTVFTMIDMARVFYMLNAASDATRHGARVAAVCDQNDPDIKTSMIARLTPGGGSSFIATSNINITYLPAGCNQTNCQTSTVALSNATISTIVGATVSVPDFTTTLPRESMNSTNNSICT